jgi:hypothetical protein
MMREKKWWERKTHKKIGEGIGEKKKERIQIPLSNESSEIVSERENWVVVLSRLMYLFAEEFNLFHSSLIMGFHVEKFLGLASSEWSRYLKGSLLCRKFKNILILYKLKVMLGKFCWFVLMGYFGL